MGDREIMKFRFKEIKNIQQFKEEHKLDPLPLNTKKVEDKKQQLDLLNEIDATEVEKNYVANAPDYNDANTGKIGDNLSAIEDHSAGINNDAAGCTFKQKLALSLIMFIMLMLFIWLKTDWLAVQLDDDTTAVGDIDVLHKKDL